MHRETKLTRILRRSLAGALAAAFVGAGVWAIIQSGLCVGIGACVVGLMVLRGSWHDPPRLGKEAKTSTIVSVCTGLLMTFVMLCVTAILVLLQAYRESATPSPLRGLPWGPPPAPQPNTLLLVIALAAAVAAVIALYVALRLVRWDLARQRPPTGHPPCPTCGYDLHGNVTGRCPECGTTIDTAEDLGGGVRRWKG